MALLDDTKVALRITSAVYDSELTSLIEAAQADLGIAGVLIVDETEPLIKRAIITYCRVHFGSPADYDRIKASYDEQKAQLMIASGHTDWGEHNDDCW